MFCRFMPSNVNIKVVVGGRFDYIKQAYSHLADIGEIIYFDNESYSRKVSLKERLKVAIINRFFNKDQLSVVKKNYIEYFPIDKLRKKDKILFILYEMNLMSTDFEAIRIIKRNYPNSKFVLFLSNTIGSVRQKATRDILSNRKIYDLIYTFNANDAEKYEFETFRGGVFPCESPNYVVRSDYTSDVFFIGKEKGRLMQLIKFVNQLNEQQIKCKFFIFADNPESIGIDITELPTDIILSQNYIPYSEVIKYTVNTKCIFEYSVSETPTLRYSEAIAFGKKLLSNAGNLKEHPLYNPQQFMVYNDETPVSDIIEFINSPLNETDKVPCSSISAQSFINELINKLF